MPINSRWKGIFREHLLTVITIVGVLGGTIIGIIVKENTSEWSKREIMYVAYPGELFLR